MQRLRASSFARRSGQDGFRTPAIFEKNLLITGIRLEIFAAISDDDYVETSPVGRQRRLCEPALLVIHRADIPCPYRDVLGNSIVLYKCGIAKVSKCAPVSSSWMN